MTSLMPGGFSQIQFIGWLESKEIYGYEIYKNKHGCGLLHHRAWVRQ